MKVKRHIGVREAPVSGSGPAIGRVRVVGRQARARLRRTTSTLAMAAGCGMLLPLAGGGISPALATDYYWDTDGATAGAGGATPAGTWQNGTTNLSTNASGTSATGAVTTTTSDRLFFSAGTNATGAYAVDLNGTTQNISRLFFQEGTVTLTNGTINSGARNPSTMTSTGDTIRGDRLLGAGVRFNDGSVTLTGTNTFTGTAQLGGSLVASTVCTCLRQEEMPSAAICCSLAVPTTRAGGYDYPRRHQSDQRHGHGVDELGPLFGLLDFLHEWVRRHDWRHQLHHQGNGSTVTFRNGASNRCDCHACWFGHLHHSSAATVSAAAPSGRLHGEAACGRGTNRRGKQTFAGTAPSYTGATTITSGTLRLWNTSAWASNTTLNGGTLNLHQTASGTSRNRRRERRDPHACPYHQRHRRHVAKNRRRNRDPDRRQHLPGRHPDRSGHVAGGIGDRIRKQFRRHPRQRLRRDDGSQQFRHHHRVARRRRHRPAAP